jgi:hypothetical protein
MAEPSEWTKERTCKTCGRTFTLRDHGHAGAHAAAEALERGGGYDSRADYFATSQCPDCATETKGDIIAQEILRQQRVREKWGPLSGLALQPGVWLARIAILAAVVAAVLWWVFH